MKHNALFAILLSLMLFACGAEQPEAPAPQPTQDAQQADDATETATDEAAAATGEEETGSEMVEESAGEPDPQADDQPIILAQAESAGANRDWQFTEGTHFARMVPTQPTLGGADKIEVAEFFWYGCGHCYNFESHINGWAKDKPATVRFVRIPATWNALVKLHAQLYYTEEVLVRNGKIDDPVGFRQSVFREYHERGNRMTSESAIQSLFARFGVSAEDFSNTWSSFEVAQKLRVAEDLARRYSITGVPAMVVNGKYRTGSSEAGSYPRLLEVIDELVERETVR